MGGYSAYITLTKYIFDKIGRVDSIQKQYGVNAMKTVSSYQYDDMGRLATKNLDPAYVNLNSGSNGLESLNYSYNLHNQITGINKDYALKNATDYNKWGHFFGEYLGYDNSLNAFAQAQLDGQVTGKIWNTQGDDAQRKYDYTYDNANRLIAAIYAETQTANSGWNHTQMDFRMIGHHGLATYDLNGNLLTMLQEGVIPGLTAPIVVDDLIYYYNAFSNKLQSVSDIMTTTASNGLSGDFKDGTNGSAPDYKYDTVGNLVIDLNKNIQSLNNGAAGTNGIHYNYLDKPDQIRLVGQGTIDIVYSADGEKLQRTFIPEATGALSTVTTYIGDFVYQSRGTLTLTAAIPYTTGTADTLDYINLEEGRIRVMTPGSTGNGIDGVVESGNLTLPQTTLAGVWDYFVMDYQKNVRMVLTEESHTAVNECTMETSRAAAEDPVFGQTGSGNEVEATRVNVPSGWTNNTTTSCSGLGNLAGHTIGPNSLQKVMAGDLITSSVAYYYQSPSTSSNPNIIPNILTSLLSAIGGPASTGTLVHANASAITTDLGNNAGFISAVEPSNSTSGTPQAYLTVIFFDERFNPVPVSDGGVMQLQVASTWTAGTSSLNFSILAPKNGYAFIYVSNRSDQSVYFDNMVVAIRTGNISEENHYYPFGLKIASISSKRLGDVNEGTIQNNYLYNGKELFEDGGLNWYDYGFRNYDPQIGRFTQLDPLTDDFPFYTPFQFAGNDPISNVDLDGLEDLNVTNAAIQSASRNVIIGVAGSATRTLVGAGTDAEHWLSTFGDVIVTAKLPAKAVAMTIKPVITTTISISVHVAMLADRVAIAKPSPIQNTTLEQKAQISLLIHDQLDPMHPLIMGKYVARATDQLRGNIKYGYSWVWRPQAISEDNGFWITAATFYIPGVDDAVISKEVEGVYDIATTAGERYIGQSNNMARRLGEHFGRGGNFESAQFEEGTFYAMEGSTQLEREVYEQYQIDKAKIETLRNRVNPMGGRRALYEKMLPQVLKKYHLPR